MNSPSQLGDGGLRWCRFVLLSTRTTRNDITATSNDCAAAKDGSPRAVSTFPNKSGCNQSFWSKAVVRSGFCQMEEEGKKNAHRPVTEPWQFTAHLRHGEKIKALLSEKNSRRWRRSRLILRQPGVCLLCSTHRATVLLKTVRLLKSYNTFFTHSSAATQYLDDAQNCEGQKRQTGFRNIWEVVVWKRGRHSIETVRERYHHQTLSEARQQKSDNVFPTEKSLQSCGWSKLSGSDRTDASEPLVSETTSVAASSSLLDSNWFNRLCVWLT